MSRMINEPTRLPEIYQKNLDQMIQALQTTQIPLVLESAKPVSGGWQATFAYANVQNLAYRWVCSIPISIDAIQLQAFALEVEQSVKPRIESAIANAQKQFRLEGYTPELLQSHVKSDFSGYAVMSFAIRLPQCPYCGRLTLPESVRGIDNNQLIKAGIVRQSHINFIADEDEDDEAVQACEICVDEGKVTFVCALCQEERPSHLLRTEVRGKYLCRVCYTEKSAKEWGAKLHEIMEL